MPIHFDDGSVHAQATCCGIPTHIFGFLFLSLGVALLRAGSADLVRGAVPIRELHAALDTALRYHKIIPARKARWRRGQVETTKEVKLQQVKVLELSDL